MILGIKQIAVDRIIRICGERKISINTLANLSGLTPSTLYSMINPERKDIGIVLIKKICDGLEITMAEFFSTKEFIESEQEIY